MLKKIMFLLLSLGVVMALAACNDNKGTATDAKEQAASKTEMPAPAAPAGWSGEIIETMNSGGYTYVHLDTGKEQVWAAAPETTVKVGQRVSVPQGMLMKDFPSSTLNRTFPELWFVSGIFPEGKMPTAGPAAKPSGGMGGMSGMKSPHGGAAKDAMGGSHNQVADAGVSGVAKVTGGYDIAGIYADKASLAGKTVKVRGRVVKFTARVMGTNWIHIQDGTGTGATADLTVTTDSEAQVGDLILVQGTLAVEKDFGAGYKYSAIIENASVTKE